MLPAILVIASLIAGIPLIARSASADGFIQDLGSLDSFSHARAVNELGQIVGESTNDDFRNPRATLWENGTMTDLGSLGGGTAFANDVNEAGQIVGGTADASGYQRAFLWENGVMTDLGVQPDGSALAINDNGQIVGTMNGERQGFLWDHGTITDLGTLGGPPVYASGISNAGQIVGWSGDTSGSAFRPWLWENGTLTDLGTPVGFTWGVAYDINEAGQVAGFGFNATGSARALLWSGGQMTDLGDLGGGISLAFGINDAGQIVGWSATAKSEHHAFLWDAGVMTDLGTLPGGYESTGDDLSNAGRIVGQASGSNAAPHAVLWTLPPAPVHDIAVTQAGASPLSAAVGTPIDVGGWVMNQGTQTESVDVTVYAGSTLVRTATVQDLAPNAFAGVSLTWNTSAVEPGSYQLRVEAAALRNETDLGDNTLVGPTIEIHPLIEAMASANPIDTDVGMAVAFTCSKTDWSAPFGPYEFAWDFGDGGTAAGDTATHRYDASGTMTATCSVVDASGGNATASVEVAVYALPSVTATADRTSAEPGTPITFTATPTGGSGGFSYNWGFGDRSSGDGAVVTHTYTDPGQYTAIVTTRDSAGGVAANTVTVTISSPTSPPAPLAAHAFAGSTATHVGIAVSFACMARDGTQPYEFAWDFGDETGAKGAAVAHAYGSPGTKTATCTVTDAGGNHATFSVVVEIYPLPTVAASVDRPNAGPGTELTFTATATGARCRWRRRAGHNRADGDDLGGDRDGHARDDIGRRRRYDFVRGGCVRRGGWPIHIPLGVRRRGDRDRSDGQPRILPGRNVHAQGQGHGCVRSLGRKDPTDHHRAGSEPDGPAGFVVARPDGPGGLGRPSDCGVCCSCTGDPSSHATEGVGLASHAWREPTLHFRSAHAEEERLIAESCFDHVRVLGGLLDEPHIECV
ncbi:MAG: PKD domain-containing protein [Methanobacteriota archaeon]|nr:MAG: PKD domain-containing protein [Euryarchaeota archaeon]